MVAAALLVLSGVYFASKNNVECVRFEATDTACEMCDAITDGSYLPKYDYRIDSFDRGDGMVIIQDIQSGQVYIVDADSISSVINNLNQ